MSSVPSEFLLRDVFQVAIEVELSTTRHVPVLLREVLQQLDLRAGLRVLDGTVGAGGHSQEISRLIGSEGVLIGLDRDSMMLRLAGEHVSGAGRFLVQASYADAAQAVKTLGLDSVDRVLVDLGLSSDQLADRDRGFGYSACSPLDMRFDVRSGESVRDFINRVDESTLERVFREYGEERFSREIAQEVIQVRRKLRIETTQDLLAVIEAAIPLRFQREARKEPATRVFQALRIAVNHELEHLQQALQNDLYNVLTSGGRIVVITFHSLEDRIVKNVLRGNDRWEPLTKKPILPSPMEMRMNPRSRSAKIRVAMKK